MGLVCVAWALGFGAAGVFVAVADAVAFGGWWSVYSFDVAAPAWVRVVAAAGAACRWFHRSESVFVLVVVVFLLVACDE